MQENEFSKFLILWKNYASAINPASVITDDATYVCFTSLKDYDFSDVKQALARLVKRDVFALKVSDVLNELQGGTNTDLEAMANIAYNNLIKATETYGEVRGYIFDHPAVNQTLNILGLSLTDVGKIDFDNDFRRKDFVKFFVNEFKKHESGVHTELKNENYCNETRLVSAFKTYQGFPVTWKLTPEQKELILTNDTEGKKLIEKITSVPPVYPQLVQEKRDPAPPADIRRQKEILEKTMNALLGVKEGD